MRSAPEAYLAARALLADDEAWLTLLQVQTAPGQVIRLVDNPEHITAGGVVWQASSFLVEGLSENDEGDLAQIRVTVSNVSRIPAALVELGQIIGQPATLYLVHTSDLATLPEELSFTQPVLSSEIGAKFATFTAGEAPSMPRVPGGVYTRKAFPQIRRLGPR